MSVCVCTKEIPSELFRLCMLSNDLIWIALIKLFCSLIVISFCAFGFNFRKNVVEHQEKRYSWDSKKFVSLLMFLCMLR